MEYAGEQSPPSSHSASLSFCDVSGDIGREGGRECVCVCVCVRIREGEYDLLYILKYMPERLFPSRLLLDLGLELLFKQD